MRPTGLALITGGRDSRVLWHDFTQLLLSALPEAGGQHGHAGGKHAQTLNSARAMFAQQVVTQSRKSKGWDFLWDFSEATAMAQYASEPELVSETSMMSGPTEQQQ